MTTITVLPSGKSYEVAAGTTILKPCSASASR